MVLDKIKKMLDAPAIQATEAPKAEGRPTVQLDAPIKIEMRQHMALLSARGKALATRWKERVDEKNTLWTIYEKHELAPQPEQFWNYLAHTANLAVDSELWRQDIHSAFEQLEQIVGQHCKETDLILARKDAKLIEILIHHEKELKAMQAAIDSFEGAKRLELEAAEQRHKKEIEENNSVWENKLQVMKDEKNKWQRAYAKKGKRK